MTAELYCPTEYEKAHGHWAVVHEKFEDGEPDWKSTVHIIPIYDKRHHQIDASCWCEPGKTEDGIVNHKVSQ